MHQQAVQSVLVRRTGDVTGDGVPDEISIIGTQSSEGGFIRDMTLVIKNGRTRRITQVPLRENAGYSPSIFLCDFTGDGILDIKVSIQSGGSGGFSYVYLFSFVHSQLRLLFDGEAYFMGKQYRAFYADGYVVVVVDESLGLTFRIDVSTDEAAQDLYDPNGRLIQPTEANVGPFIMAIPIMLNEEAESCQLQVLTRVYGQFAADTIGYLQDYITWRDDSWQTIREDLAIDSSAPVSGN